MSSLKEIRGRIASVKGTLKITSAMRLISSAKLHGAQNAIGSMLPYEKGLDDIMQALGTSPAVASRLGRFAVAGDSPRKAVILVTSNQTLCGAFNNNITKAFAAQDFDRENTVVYAIGRFGMKYAAKAGYQVKDMCSLAAAPDYAAASAIADAFMNDFAANELSGVTLVYAHFASAGHQPVVVENFLPVEAGAFSKSGGEGQNEVDYIVEPSPEAICDTLLPMLMRLKLHTVILDSTAAEHAARMLAMQIASDNADSLISELSLQYNKLRQQAITAEILDLLSGQQA